MIEVKLARGKYKLDPERAVKVLKKKLLKEGVLRELRERESFTSKGRKAYLERSRRKYIAGLASQES